MIDLDALEAAGVRDAPGRRPLIEYLVSLGFTADDMVEAEKHGRLFALAGDAIVRSGRRVHSLRSAAESLQLPLADVEHAWAALGLTVADVDQLALSPADLDGLRTWAELSTLIGADVALGVARVLGAGLARLAEAESSAIRAGIPAVQINHTFDELETARAYAGVAGFVPRIGVLIDAVHRQHIESARVYFEGVVLDTSATVVCGIGFVDLSGFTALTQQLLPGELSGLLSAFSATVSDVVHAHGGRVVKFIGDAVMWVSPSAGQLATAARDLVSHPKAREAGLQVRAGLAHGSMLALDGDYFGNPVNLAARLVSVAEPGQILVSAALRTELTGWPADPVGPFTLRGFEEPVPAHALRDATASGDR
ncbi:MAG TPA: adenylate/guanylate cyclase domain-containing protein [Jatrophihabitans sp.]|nr:adenylate/guanylate cyclase domain-containing protein [Jatrophihabitans sp.]